MSLLRTGVACFSETGRRHSFGQEHQRGGTGRCGRCLGLGEGREGLLQFCRDRTNGCVCVRARAHCIYAQESACVIMEAEKPRDPQSEDADPGQQMV